MKLIKNGKVLTKDGVKRLDILIEGEAIKQIGENLEVESNCEVIDAQDFYVTPGGIDVHTHFDIDVGIISCDNFYTGGRAAVLGGTTTIIDHPGFGPKGCSLHHQIDNYLKKATNSPADYSFHGVVQELADVTFEELKQLKERGISSFKIYMTYDYKFDDKDILRFFTYAKELDIITCVHAENHEIIQYLREKYGEAGKGSAPFHALSRPDYTEAEAVNRLILLAETVGYEKLYLVHISSKEALKVIKQYKDMGKKFYTETCTQYLYLTDSEYLKENGVDYILSPPLRKEEDKLALQNGMNNGYVDVVATDHCTFSPEAKAKGKEDFRKCPNGIPGVEERMTLMLMKCLENEISTATFLETACENPAKIFGVYPKKGLLEIGSDADIVLFKEKEHNFENPASEAKYSCYSDIKSTLKVDTVMVRGEILVKGENFVEDSRRGKFIERN